MTHDELLARISSTMPKDNSDVYVEDVVTALRAVVELHKPKNYILKEGEVTEQWCTGDTETLTKYPCPTIQAIEKELK